MSKYRQAKKIDKNQPGIVADLRKIPGFSVETDKDDIICGFRGVTLWVEVKEPGCYSRKTGKLLESAKTDSQKILDQTFSGARIYAKSAAEIFEWFKNRLKEIGIE